jgi:large subunit ribosomal protein L10
MKREDKEQVVNTLVEELNNAPHFYVADTSDLDGADISLLRRKCFEKNITLKVVKNTLLKRALEASEKDTEELYDSLKGPTSIMFTETGNVPAKLIKEFRKDHDKPILKSAFVEESVYVGEDQLEVLSNIKSKEELLGDLVALLQSPAKNVISALQSGGNTISGVLQTLSEKSE